MDILSLVYLGNIQYFSKLCFGNCVIDVWEHYERRSYRNRCEILNPQGILPLTVNVKDPGNYNKTAVRDVRIDHSKRWRHGHWQSLASAYKGSPYFDHYAGLFEPVYTGMRKYEFLFDLNNELIEILLGIFSPGTRPDYSTEYIQPERGTVKDFRNTISPKARLRKPDPEFHPTPYWQVFSDITGFIPNASVIDLLFCEGPGSVEILRKSYRPAEKL